jgi:hypothetical protein
MYPSSKRVRITPSQIAVILRAQDGPFQAMVIGPRRDVSFYRLTGRVLRPLVSTGIPPALHSLSQIDADVFVFLSVRLEALNDFCLDVLTSEALNPQCGVVSASGVDPENLFAVRREVLEGTGGLVGVSADRIAELYRRIKENVQAQQLRVAITPQAVAASAV